MRTRIVCASLIHVLMLCGCPDGGTTVDPSGTTGGTETTTFGSGGSGDDGGESGCAEYPLPFPMGGDFNAYRENNGAPVESVLGYRRGSRTLA